MKHFQFQVLISGFFLLFLVACESPFETEIESPAPIPEVSSSPSVGAMSSGVAKKAKANAEIFHEMFTVVFMREPKDRAEFGNWVDTLNQGASLEGVYNGLTHSEDYRRLEKVSPKAPEKLVKAFRREIGLLEAELPVPPPRENLDLASLFILKRVLCDEALKVIASKNADNSKVLVATWYSKWAVLMTQRNVDFGISLRNRPDEAFHFKWATEVGGDQLMWEVLNRLHRVLNAANK